MRKFVLFLPLLSLLSACHFSVNKSDQVAAYRSLCLQKGCKIGTWEFEKCVKEQESNKKIPKTN